MFRMRRVMIALAWASIVASLLVTTARAGGARDHSGGFFLRMTAGGGPTRTEFSEAGESIELSDVGFDFNIAIGGMVTPNLALHGSLGGWTVTNPDAEGIDALGPFSGELDGDVNLSMYGGGLTYYFMPINIYVSGSAGFSMLSLSSPAGDSDTDMGPAFDLSIGKEWWVGNSWGLGLAFAFGYHSVPEEGSSENWSGTSFTVRFSATLN